MSNAKNKTIFDIKEISVKELDKLVGFEGIPIRKNGKKNKKK